MICVATGPSSCLPFGVAGSAIHDLDFSHSLVRLLDEANTTLDPARRYELLAEAEAYMLAAQPIIPFETNATNWMKKPYVKGMYPNPGTLHAWKFVYIEHDPAKWDSGVPDMSQ